MGEEKKPLQISREAFERAFNGRDLPEDHHHAKLLRAIQARLPELKEMQQEFEGHWRQVDSFYRFYHQSFKVLRIQAYTTKMVEVFHEIRDAVDWEPEPKRWLPKTRLNPWFLQIVEEGTGKEWEDRYNSDWLLHTRPLMEAYFHAKTFLDMMIACGENMEAVSTLLSSDWAAVLYLYNMR